MPKLTKQTTQLCQLAWCTNRQNKHELPTNVSQCTLLKTTKHCEIKRNRTPPASGISDTTSYATYVTSCYMFLQLLVTPMMATCCAGLSKVLTMMQTLLDLLLRGRFATSFGLQPTCSLLPFSSLLCLSLLSFLDLLLDSPLPCDFNDLLPCESVFLCTCILDALAF